MLLKQLTVMTLCFGIRGRRVQDQKCGEASVARHALLLFAHRFKVVCLAREGG